MPTNRSPNPARIRANAARPLLSGVATLALLLSAISGATAQQPPPTAAPVQPAAISAAAPAPAPTPAALPAEQLPGTEVTGLMGRTVLGPAQKVQLGRVVDLLIDTQGRIRAVVVDVGGFMGVGSRKVALAWPLLHVEPGEKGPVLSVAIDLERIRGWVEYAPGRPVAILGAPADPPGTGGTGR